MVKKRRRFSREYKQEVAEMVLRGGHEIHVLSKELDLRPDMIQRWVKKVHQEIPLRGESTATRMTTTKKKRRATPSNVKLTKEEQQIENSAAEFEGYPLDRARIQAAAKATLRKDARTNIRLMHSTLAGLKMQAARDGLPYQTLIASVLHRYVTGRLKEVQE